MEETNSKVTRNVLLGSLITAMLAVAGCGGGSGGSAEVPVATTLSGTAAAGAPIIGQVTVKGSLGVTKSALIEADGTYDVDVTGLTAPYRLRAVGTVGGKTYKLHSYAEAADVGGNVNITPFTDLIVANAASQVAESYFDSATPADLDPAEVDAQEAALQAKLQDVFNALGVATAIDLLNSTFSADHSGLDAALDAVRIEVDPALQIATITNLLEPASTPIVDSVTDATDNTDVLQVIDPVTLSDAATDTQAIAGVFDLLTAAFTNGLPTSSAIQDYFADDFVSDDESKALLLTDITTDPDAIGLMFSGVVVSNLDSAAGTAEVTFNFGNNGVLESEAETWFAAKNTVSGLWQLRGDQRIVDTYFGYHCNDYDGPGGFEGSCGINTQFWDEDFSNNNTANAPIASGTVKIIDGTTSAVKATVFLGTPGYTAPGDVQVYNEQFGDFQGDWKGFSVSGIGQVTAAAAGDIDPAVFAVGDTIEYALYTADLDITTPSVPAVVGSPVATYTDTVQFVPSPVETLTSNKYPAMTDATVTAMSGFTLGNDLTVAWTVATGTRISEILVEVSDSAGNRIEIWDWVFGTTATSKTYASTALDSAAATSAGLLDTDATYNLKVRVYAEDELTGQDHSIDYNTVIPGPAAVVTPPPTSGLTCGYESGWNDLADGGLGAPITPNSFADYESVVTDCLGVAPSIFTAADVAGSVYVDGGLEAVTFDALGAALGTELDPGTGTYDDDGLASSVEPLINFEWWVEAATCAGCTHSYVVVYADDSMNIGILPPGFWFRETIAITDVIGTPGVSGAITTMYRYSEQSNYSDTDRAVGTDAEIWFSPNNVLQ